MHDFYRHNLFRIFALFFIIVTPFLAIFSLGFNPDFTLGELANTMSVTIETFPGSATTRIGDQVVLRNNGELKTGDGKFVDLTIDRENYESERFSLWSKTGQNSLAKITPLYLLPTENKQIAALPEYNNKQADIREMLSEDLLLLGSENSYYLANYTVNNIQPIPNEIQNPDQIKLTSDTWKPLFKDMFWSIKNQTVLAKIGGNWKLYSFQKFSNNIIEIVAVDENDILLHDKNQQVWLHNLIENQFSFIDSNVTGLASTINPNAIWVWKADSIFRLNRSKESVTQWNLASSQIYKNSALFSITQPNFDEDFKEKPEYFVVKNVFQGILISVNGYTYYVSDFNTNAWQLITNDAKIITADSSTIFWLNKDNYLFSYNLAESFEVSFGKIELSGSPKNHSIFYYDSWKRLFIYSESEVISVWFNKDTKANSQSAAIIRYYPKPWITNKDCYQIIIDRTQFCIENNTLISYRNPFLTSIF